MFIQVEKLEDGMPGRLKVTAQFTEGPETFVGEYNTVSISVFKITEYCSTMDMY